MAPPPPNGKSGGLSLYANLQDPASESSAASGTISKAPVVFAQSSDASADTEDAATADKQQISAASLRFQPIKRPQLPSQKPKVKSAFPKPASTPVAPGIATSTNASSARAPVKTSLADWASTVDDDDDVNGFYGGEKRQRGGRKKRKKNRDAPEMITNWDDIYDPSRPNNYEEYKRSDEKIREVRDWKDRLYAHRMARRRSSDFDSDDESPRPRNRTFAPPAFNFAPPASLNDTSKILSNESGEDAYSRRLHLSQDQNQEVEMEDAEYQPPPPPPPDSILEAPTGEDAYARRLQMSQQPPPPPPPPPASSVQPTPPISTKTSVSAFQPASATISRAPVRYELPPAPEDIPATEEELEAVFATEEAVQDEEGDAPRSLRPGQKGFAERLMAKYGWTKGSGLGATGSGIVNPLQVKVEKQKKKPDSEGGGFATRGGHGKIIPSKKGKEDEAGKFGPMSEVIVLYGMLDGLDLDNELDNSEGGGLMQEIGEECNEKYGRVERVFIHRESSDPIPVFVKFTAQLSALRAVNALEGRIFNGNKITAKFFDVDKFERGVYQ